MRISRPALIAGLALIAPAAKAVVDACDAFGPLSQSTTAGTGDQTYSGTTRYQQLGAKVANVGDINGDGYDDLAIGSPGDGSNGARAGLVSIWLSNGATLDPTGAADVRLFGSGVGDNAGAWIASAGDLNDDDIDDLLIGSQPNTSSAWQAGVAWVVFGSTTLATTYDLEIDADVTLVGAFNGDEFGVAGEGVGDVNGDTYDDLAIGAPGADPNGSASGAAFVFHGPLSGAINAVAADQIFTGEAAGDRAGSSITRIGDFGGGASDFAVGAPLAGAGAANDGALYVILGGGATGVHALADAAFRLRGSYNERLGISAAVAGDVDGDNDMDLWIGARQSGPGKQGAAYLVRYADLVGGDETVETVFEARVRGLDANDFLGTSVAGNVDFDNDGELDVVIGADKAESATLSTTGAAWVLHGPFTGDFAVTATDGRIAGDVSGAFTGYSVAAFSDLNNDDFSDVLIGSYGANPGAKYNAGAASLFYGGRDVADVTTWYRDQDNDGWGTSLTTQSSCTKPLGYVAVDGDCNDTSTAFRPYALETNCGDPNDYSCDGRTGTSDFDGDGVTACGGDCWDIDANVGSGDPEVCGDNLDNDCSGTADGGDAVDALTYRADADGDGYGDASAGFPSCTVPSFFIEPPVTVGGDCDDDDEEINPEALEFCDSTDNNCDGFVDESLAVDADGWFADQDEDGYADHGPPVFACIQPPGYAADPRDCDDNDAAIHPGSIEVCDDADNDCDGMGYLGGPMSAEDADWRFSDGTPELNLGHALARLPSESGVDGIAVSGGGPEYAGIVLGVRVDVWINRYRAVTEEDLPFPIQWGGTGGSNLDHFRIEGSSLADFGHALAGGDFNGDGEADLAVGAPRLTAGGSQAGGVYIYYGPLSGTYAPEDADVRLTGIDGFDSVGTSLAAGDLDGDSMTDLLIGAPGADCGVPADRQGAMYELHGGVWTSGTAAAAARASLCGATAKDRLGHAVVILGDTDGDEQPEIAATAPEQGTLKTGYVAVVTGASGGHTGVMTASATITGPRANQQLGRAIAGIDANEDGLQDLAVSGGAGKVWIVPSTPTGLASGNVESLAMTTLIGTGGQELGESLTSDTDMSCASGGVVITIYGDDTIEPDCQFRLVIGAPGDDEGGTNAGAAYVYVPRAGDPSMIDVEDLESMGRLDPSGFPTYSVQNLGGPEGGKIIGDVAGAELGSSLLLGVNSYLGGAGDLVLGSPGALAADAGVYGFMTTAYGTDVPKQGAGAAWSYALTVDGSDADWNNEVRFNQFTGDAVVTWDATDVYVGTKLVDVRTGGNQHWFVVYFGNGDNTGSTQTVQYNTQLQTLPFHADYALAWKANDSFSRLSTWNGSTWVHNNGFFTGGGGAKQESNVNEVVEFRIPRSALGDPTELDVSAYWLYEGAGFESSFSPFPEMAFSTGTYNPNITEYYPFNLDLGAAPELYGSLPTGTGAPSLFDDMTLYWHDRDTDSFGDENSDPFLACPMHAPISFANPSAPLLAAVDDPADVTDCDDSDAGINPDADEINGNGVDEDCDGADGMGTNLPPASVTCALTAASYGHALNVSTSASAVDPEGGLVTFSYAWSVNGVLDPSETGPTYPASKTDVGEEISAVVTAFDPELDSTQASCGSADIVNTQPLITACTLTPSGTAYRADTLVVSGVTGTDADGESVTPVYEWYLNGVYDIGNPTNAYDLSGTTPLDLVEVVCYVADGYGLSSNSLVRSANVTNHPPTLVVDPALVIDHTLALVDVTTSTDDDGDTVTLSYVWSVNGIVVPGETTDSLDGSFFVRDDTVSVVVTADDGYDTTQDSASATAPNAPPTVASATLGPAEIREATTATCTAGAASDSDGDTVTLSYAWYVNGVLVGTGTTLTGASFDKDDTVQCRITPNDGIENGTTAASAIQNVLNTAPTAPVVRITPEVADSRDDIGCVIDTPATDADPGDVLDYVFTWDLDGTDWTTEATTITYADDTIPSANVLAGTFTCEAAAFDGDDLGDVADDVHDVFEYYDRQKIRGGLQGTHTCALLDNGTVKCWGFNTSGQLGQGHANALGDGPGEMGDALPAIDLPGTLAVEMISVGNAHVCALMEDNNIYCWGQNTNSELGRSGAGPFGDGAGEMGDNLVALPAMGQIAQLESGETFNCVRNTDGQVWCWGSNGSGQLGTGNTTASATPVQISLGTSRTAKWIGLGSNHACAILDNDSVKCWGANASGQLGIDSATARGDNAGEMGDSLPTAILGAGTPVFVDGGAAHSCVRFSNNTIKCWGANGVGQLGRGNTTVMGDAAGEMATIGPISVSTTKTIQRLFVGFSHNCVVFTDGSMKCWGNGANFRLGYGDTVVRGDGAGEMGDSLPFVSLSGAPKAWNVELPNGYACVATECGTIQCWGNNNNGQLGLGSVTAQTLPSSNLSLGTGRYVNVESGAGCLNPWSHTITIDGDPSDWLASEQFATSQGGATWTGVTWDSTYIYIATKHPDVASGGASHWFVSYFGNGSTTGPYTVRDGITHNTQDPYLAVPSQTAARWKADNSFDSALNGDAGLNAWFGTSWYFRDQIASSLLAESNANQFMEFRIRRDELFLNFSVLVVQAHWVYEGAGFESSYAATPSTAHTQGVYDPDFSKYLRFQLNSSAGPAGAEIRDALP